MFMTWLQEQDVEGMAVQLGDKAADPDDRSWRLCFNICMLQTQLDIF